METLKLNWYATQSQSCASLIVTSQWRVIVKVFDGLHQFILPTTVQIGEEHLDLQSYQTSQTGNSI